MENAKQGGIGTGAGWRSALCACLGGSVYGASWEGKGESGVNGDCAAAATS